MTRVRAVAVASSLMLGIVGCSPTWSISLDGASTAATPIFTLAREGEAGSASIAAFRVDACDARGSPPIDTHWLTVAPGPAQPIARIAYGAPPPGWRSATGPHPLAPGCYRAAVADAPPLEFDVRTDGRVTARR